MKTLRTVLFGVSICFFLISIIATYMVSFVVGIPMTILIGALIALDVWLYRKDARVWVFVALVLISFFLMRGRIATIMETYNQKSNISIYTVPVEDSDDKNEAEDQQIENEIEEEKNDTSSVSSDNITSTTSDTTTTSTSTTVKNTTPAVVEKVVVKEVPVEKVVVKEVPKVVEKEVVKEVPKVVEKEVIKEVEKKPTTSQTTTTTPTQSTTTQPNTTQPNVGYGPSTVYGYGSGYGYGYSNPTGGYGYGYSQNGYSTAAKISGPSEVYAGETETYTISGVSSISKSKLQLPSNVSYVSHSGNKVKLHFKEGYSGYAMVGYGTSSIKVDIIPD